MVKASVRAIEGDVRSVEGDVRDVKGDVRAVEGDVRDIKEELEKRTVSRVEYIIGSANVHTNCVHMLWWG